MGLPNFCAAKKGKNSSNMHAKNKQTNKQQTQKGILFYEKIRAQFLFFSLSRQEPCVCVLVLTLHAVLSARDAKQMDTTLLLNLKVSPIVAKLKNYFRIDINSHDSVIKFP